MKISDFMTKSTKGIILLDKSQTGGEDQLVAVD